MFDKILEGYFMLMVWVNGWYAKRSDIVAGLLYPALVAFYMLWITVAVTFVVILLVVEVVRIPFYGLNGLGEDAKLLAECMHEIFEETFGPDEEEEEPEEEPEETIEESVEVVDDEVDNLDGYLAESEES